jgi:hypothetical protein
LHRTVINADDDPDEIEVPSFGLRNEVRQVRRQACGRPAELERGAGNARELDIAARREGVMPTIAAPVSSDADPLHDAGLLRRFDRNGLTSFATWPANQAIKEQ